MVAAGSIAAVAAVMGCGGELESPVDVPAPEPDLQIVAASGNHQQGPVGTSLHGFLVALVTAGPVRPVEDVRVRWEVVEGDGELSLKGSFTDPQGLSAAVLFLGQEPGEIVVRAFLDNGEEARFTALATEAGAPTASISSDSGR